MKKSKKITTKESAEQVLDLLTAFSLIKGEELVANFIADLLTESEVLTLAKRLRIAKLLLSGDTMDAVVEKTDAGKNTVAKVAHWLVSCQRIRNRRRWIDLLGDGLKEHTRVILPFSMLCSLFSEKGYSLERKKKVRSLVGVLKEKRTASKEIDEAYIRA